MSDRDFEDEVDFEVGDERDAERRDSPEPADFNDDGDGGNDFDDHVSGATGSSPGSPRRDADEMDVAADGAPASPPPAARYEEPRRPRSRQASEDRGARRPQERRPEYGAADRQSENSRRPRSDYDARGRTFDGGRFGGDRGRNGSRDARGPAQRFGGPRNGPQRGQDWNETKVYTPISYGLTTGRLCSVFPRVGYHGLPCHA